MTRVHSQRFRRFAAAWTGLKISPAVRQARSNPDRRAGGACLCACSFCIALCTPPAERGEVDKRLSPTVASGRRSEGGMSLKATHMTCKDFDDTKWQGDLWADWSFWIDGDWPLEAAWKHLSPGCVVTYGRHGMSPASAWNANRGHLYSACQRLCEGFSCAAPAQPPGRRTTAELQAHVDELTQEREWMRSQHPRWGEA